MSNAVELVWISQGKLATVIQVKWADLFSDATKLPQCGDQFITTVIPLHWQIYIGHRSEKYRTSQENIGYIGHMYVSVFTVYTSAMPRIQHHHEHTNCITSTVVCGHCIDIDKFDCFNHSLFVLSSTHKTIQKLHRDKYVM